MKNGLRKKVASIATSAAMLGSVAAYNAEAVLADDELDTENTPAIENEQVSENNERETVKEDSVKFEGVYDTEKEAQDKAAEKEKEYKDKGYGDIKSDITKIETKKETGNVIEKQLESDFTTEEDAYTDLTREEAEKKKEELEVDNHDKRVTVVIKSYQKDTGKDEIITIKKNFNSREESDAYIESLKEQGYVISEDELTENTKEEGRSFNAIFDTKEEAEKALKDFEDKYDNVTGNVSEIRNESKDSKETTKGTIKYDNIEDAIKAKEALEADNSSYTITAKVREEKVSGKIEEKIESEKFGTEAEALAYIEKLKSEGYDVSDLEVKLVSYEESIWKDEDGVIVDPGQADGKKFNYGHFDVTLVTSFTKIDKNGNETTVKGTMKVNSVNIAGKNIAMEGPTRDPNVGHIEYTSEKRHGLNVTNKSLVKITGTITVNGQELPYEVEGYLSESQNVCGGNGNMKGYDLRFKQVTIINGKVLVDTNLVNNYQVKGIAKKNTEKSEYYVDSEKTTKGYDYNASATGTETVKDGTYELNGKASKDILEDRYALDITTETKKYEYEKEIVDTILYSLEVKAVIPQKVIEEDPVIDNNDNSKPENKTQTVANKTEVKENTPKTGDDTNVGLMAGALGIALAGAAGAAGIARTRKRN